MLDEITEETFESSFASDGNVCCTQLSEAIQFYHNYRDKFTDRGYLSDARIARDLASLHQNSQKILLGLALVFHVKDLYDGLNQLLDEPLEHPFEKAYDRSGLQDV